MSERVLVVVAHPDDECFSMGSTIARYVRDGNAVTVLALSDGVGSRFSAGLQDDDYWAAIGRRMMHFSAACAVLGATPQYLRAFPDQQADTVSQLETNRLVHRVIEEQQPTTVYTHHDGDLNLDHRCVCDAVRVSMRGRSVRLYSMAPEWPHLCVRSSWSPNVTMPFYIPDIETKLRACQCYTDELREYPHPRSQRAVSARLQEEFMRIQ